MKRHAWRRLLVVAVGLIVLGLLVLSGSTTLAAEAAPLEPSNLVSPQSLSASLPWLIGATVLSLVPAVLLMSTCFVRFAVVLGLLRQALGTPQVLPNQVMMALSMFLTFTVMAPVWRESYETGWKPYSQSAGNSTAAFEKALPKMLAPIRLFMSRQIKASENTDGVWMLLDLQRQHAGETDTPEPQSWDEVPISVLLPSFLLSELKTGFLIGFQLFLPFLVIDFVIASVLTALGLTTLTPTSVALPFKLLLFVLIDGWFLTVGMLLASVSAAQ
ncbi:MAG: flagellar biosynthetic protein FliP [Planctomycetota bacterium]|nr:MAG: flagellar biosynthetic protein FliP [Planctomycetota bacterium]